MPDGSEQKLEVLSNGQQVVCYGLHKDTHQPYRWHGGEPVVVIREDLPYVRQGDMEAFTDAAATQLVREFSFVPIDSKAKANGNKQQTKTESNVGVGEQNYAEVALEGFAAELATTKKNSRNDKLNAL